MLHQTVENAIAGFLVAGLLGLLVFPFVELATQRPKPPFGITSDEWLEAINRPAAGDWIGFLERMLALIAFWSGQLTIVAALFAFKLAAKWETWKNVVQFPTKLARATDDLDFLRARNAVGAWLMGRFMIGTLANALVGFLAAFVGRHWLELYALPRPIVASLVVFTVTALCVIANTYVLREFSKSRTVLACSWALVAIAFLWIDL